ncbi:MAG: hypothetical protein UW30_C0022G0008 [Candidatus Giovannonibacteria bacterium GW2011_GWA2_44_13b]|uniref:Uncharacterized protein n=2 Tax=Candidatus Giovannoniibacteriota TaxID=1752738 RepID=A0A0G1H1Y7_9BACT|nr:MAG: hypothetical protein UW30_C0022G0008 [Candidatus Giovannonibacteria bacterium GW2011_GWA2_44_13b]OGF82948.1 MAG: hypothetical protein A2924_03055 [Candidatus Giovannonibacteria bacterium RIFCSPLOWO2_01_FULL_44_16]
MQNEQPKEYTIENFREEIAEIAKDIENEGDFPKNLDVKALTEEDMKMWLKIKDGSMMKGDMDKYRKNFEMENGFENRYDFFMFIANKANVIISRRETM